MATEPIPKIVLQVALPSIITSVYHMTDTYFVSALGTNTTAAASVNTSLDHLVTLAGTTLAAEANSCIARFLGAKEQEKANRVLSTAFFLALIIGAAALLLGTLFMLPLVRMLGATPSCEQYAMEYATYLLLAAPFMASSFVLNQCLRAENSATLTMIGMGFGGILN